MNTYHSARLIGSFSPSKCFMLRYPQTHLRQNDFCHPQVPSLTKKFSAIMFNNSPTKTEPTWGRGNDARNNLRKEKSQFQQNSQKIQLKILSIVTPLFLSNLGRSRSQVLHLIIVCASFVCKHSSHFLFTIGFSDDERERH